MIGKRHKFPAVGRLASKASPFAGFPMVQDRDDKPALNLDFLLGVLPSGVTHSRTSLATYRNKAGLIVYADHNLILQSQDFGTTWSAFGTPVITANSDVAPDGTTTADTIADDDAAGTEGVTQPITVANDSASYTASFYIKKASVDPGVYPRIVLEFYDGTGKTINVGVDHFAGAIGEDGSSGGSVSIEDAGDYWRAFITLANNGTGNTTAQLAFYPAQYNSVSGGTASGFSTAYTGSVVLWGAQLEKASFASSYKATTTAAYHAPRFDHDVDGNPLGLLIEGARTNLHTQATNPSALNAGTSFVVNSGTTATAPDGSSVAELAASNATGNHAPGHSVTFATSTQYAISVYAKAGEVTQFALQASGGNSPAGRWFNLTTGAVGSQFSTNSGTSTLDDWGIEDAGNGWYRCWIVVTQDNTTVATQVRVWLGEPGATERQSWLSAPGNTTTGAFFWGWQAEAGAFPSSLYLTAGATGARSADVATITDLSWLNTAEGTLYVEWSTGAGVPDAAPVANFDDGSSVNVGPAIGITPTTIYARLRTTAGADVVAWNDNETTANATFKAAIAWRSGVATAGNGSFAYNGSLKTADSDSGAALSGAQSVLRIGSQLYGSAAYSFTHISRLAYYPRRLPDANLANRTA